MVGGAPGNGRSALLAAAAERAASAGADVYAVRCEELEADVPLSVAARLVAPIGLETWSGPEQLARRIVALLASATRPVLLAIDDAQWADDASLRALTLLALAPGTARLTAVIALCDGDPGCAREEVRALRSVSKHHLTVGPLSDAAVKELARTRDREAAELLRLSAGTPFLVAALLDDAGTGVVAEHVARRLARLGEDERALARACAIAGACTSHLAARLAGLDRTRGQAAADALAAAHLLAPGGPLRFRQPLVGQVVRAGMSPFERSAAHACAAALLDADAAPVGDVAAHLLETAPGGDPQTVALLRHAARTAIEEGDPARASRLLDRAAAEPPPVGQRAETLFELGWARLGANEDAPAEPLREAFHRPGAEVAARDWHRLARLMIATGEPAAAARAVDRGSAASPDASTAEVLLADALSIGVMIPPLPSPVHARLQELGRGAQAGILPRSAALRAGLAMHLASRGEPTPSVERIALSAFTRSPLVDDDRLGGALSFAAGALVLVDAPTVAGTLLDDAVDAAGARGWPLAAAAALMWRALARLRAGRLDGARADAERALGARATQFAPHLMIAAPAVAEGFADLGELEDAEAMLARVERRTPMLLHARGRVAFARGDASAALADFEAAGALLEAIGVTSPAIVPWRSSAALAAHHLGRENEAQAFAAVEVLLARRTGAPRALGVALRAAGCVRDRASGLAPFEEAVTVLEESPSRLARARALLDLGAAHRRDGRRAEARVPLARALDLAAAYGAKALAAEAGGELRAAGARPRRAARTGRDALTPSERRVALLAAEGLSSADIAQRLFVSRKTVESHLHRCYRKLGIRSRGELGALFGDEASPSAR